MTDAEKATLDAAVLKLIPGIANIHAAARKSEIYKTLCGDSNTPPYEREEIADSLQRLRSANKARYINVGWVRT